MSELKEHLFCECDEIVREYRGQLSNEMRPYYLKSEADKVIADLEESHKKEVGQLLMEIEEIVKGAISMFRLSENCRGLDLKSPLGRIANTAFKHWCFVESIQNKNRQLQEDKERLLHNNHHLLDEVERLKEFKEEKYGSDISASKV